MKKIIFLVMLVLALNQLSAANLQFVKTSSTDAIINGVYEPAIFNFNVTNLGGGDYFQFYNLLGFSMFPKGTVSIGGGETKNIPVTIYPRSDFNFSGLYTFDFFAQGQDKLKQSQSITIRFTDLKGAFEVGSAEISPETNSIGLFISNSLNFNFNGLDVKFDSPFFKLERQISLAPFEKKQFTIELNKDDFKKLMAGFYTLNAEVNYKGQNANVEGTIKFVEQDLLKTTQENSGFIISTSTIEKKNEGNIVTSAQATIKKNIISRLFTTFSLEPDSVSRTGFAVYDSWSKDLKPGESLAITAKTNWLFPLLLVLFVAGIVVVAKQYSKTSLLMKKRVSFVNAKGGEFALKVSITVGAKKYVERVNVTDIVPPLVKVYERFGGVKPTRVNPSSRRIEWNLGNMMPGERRVLSYVIYSKVGIMGRFSLPSATAVYEKDGEVHETDSNRAFFVAEQRKKDIEY